MKKMFAVLAAVLVFASVVSLQADKGGYASIYSATAKSLGTGRQMLNSIQFNTVATSGVSPTVNVYDAATTTVSGTVVWSMTLPIQTTSSSTVIPVNRQFLKGILVVVVPDSGIATVTANYNLAVSPNVVP